jgi:hypothetical protein
MLYRVRGMSVKNEEPSYVVKIAVHGAALRVIETVDSENYSE